MANKPDTVGGGVQSTLQRGKACLRCRKRKMRCDGTKPACQQCTRAKKGDACEYDDGKGKTRTQILRETIARLENRIHELEDPEYVSASVTLYDPHVYHQSESSSSSYGSPTRDSLSASHSPFASETTSSPHGSWTHLPNQGLSPSPSPFTPDIFFEDSIPSYSSFELGPILLDIFAPHRHQCSLGIHMGHLRDSLNLPASEQRHPALMNAIYLWACFVSRPEPLCQQEEHFLAQALDAHRDGLRHTDKLVDVIQASCLLSMYFLVNGRILEGSYHLSAASALAVQCRMHVGISNGQASSANEGFDLKPTKTDYREGERILAFWQVYNLDRCWSVVLRKPSIIPDGPDSWSSITCPWPLDMADYDAGHMGPVSTFPTVRAFLEGDVSPAGFSTQALRAKASTLYARADQLSLSWDPRMKLSNSFIDEMQALELSITRFIPTLVPIHQLDGAMPEDRYIYLAAHTLAHSAIMHLYRPFSRDDPGAYQKCLRGARAVVAIINNLGDRDYDLLDPMVGPCWTSASDVLIAELDNIESTWPLISSADARNEVGTIAYALNNLSTRFPVLGSATSKIQKRLSQV